MNMHQRILVGECEVNGIDWEMTPDLSFGTYESWGGRERVRNNDERIHYFFIDAWGDVPKLCLMERGVKYAKVLAEINAPQELVNSCVHEQGEASRFEKSYAINPELRSWLIENLFTSAGNELVKVLAEESVFEDMGPDLPLNDDRGMLGQFQLPSEEAVISDESLEALVIKYNFFDGILNPDGRFCNRLVSSGNDLTVLEQKTSLMWQRGGIDITSNRTMRRKIEEINKEGYAGFHDWRMPTMEEALSLMEGEPNSKGVHLQLCFSKDQPFIFVAARRLPGGYWFVDYKQGRAFWSSGTIPGGFGRLCRSV